MNTERDSRKLRRYEKNFYHFNFGRKRKWRRRSGKWGRAMSDLIHKKFFQPYTTAT